MVLRKFNVKDRKYRCLAAATELNKLTLKFFERQAAIEQMQKQSLFLMYSSKNGRSLNSFVRLRNGCLFTGKTRFVFRRARLSRMQFKNFSSRGFLMGVRKSSW